MRSFWCRCLCALSLLTGSLGDVEVLMLRALLSCLVRGVGLTAWMRRCLCRLRCVSRAPRPRCHMCSCCVCAGLVGLGMFGELRLFWACPLPLLDDLHALLCRFDESWETEFAASVGLAEFRSWTALASEGALHGLQIRWQRVNTRVRRRPYVVGAMFVLSRRLWALAAGLLGRCASQETGCM